MMGLKWHVLLVPILLSQMMQHSTAAFPEDPMNTTCTLDQSFVVRCRPPPTAVAARWVYGGAQLYITHPPSGVRPTQFNDLFKLDMTCVLQRHYVTIQCIAIFDIHIPEEEAGPAALIKVQGLPDRVTNLNSTSNATAIEVVWDMLDSSETYCVQVGGNTIQNFEICGSQENYFVFVHDGLESVTNDSVYEFVVTGVSDLGRGPTSSPLHATFLFGLPDVVENVEVTSNNSVIAVTWDSLGPDVSYCMSISYLIMEEGVSLWIRDEICELSDTFFLFNRPDPESVDEVYNFVIISVNDVGRSSEYFSFQANYSNDTEESIVTIYTSLNLSTLSTTLAGNDTTSKSKVTLTNTVVVIVVVFCAILLSCVLLCIMLFYTIYRCYLNFAVRKENGGIEMLRCDAYQSVEVQQAGSLKDFEEDSNDKGTYEGIMSIPDEPVYAAIK